MSGIFGDNESTLIARFLSGKLSKDELAFKLVPLLTLEIIRRYLRVESQGLEHIPRAGPGIIISNHSGYSGFDAIMLANEIRRATGRIPRLVAHKLWFLGKPVRMISEKMGLIEADMNHSLDVLKSGELIILFPEGEAGNFKPTHRRYRLQEFKRGFVRLAMISGAPLIPSFVIGAEETHINLSQIRFAKYLIGTVIPIPLNVIPLPVKWTIHFHTPYNIGTPAPEDAMNRKRVYELSKELRHYVQRAIVDELRKRKPFVEAPKSL